MKGFWGRFDLAEQISVVLIISLWGHWDTIQERERVESWCWISQILYCISRTRDTGTGHLDRRNGEAEDWSKAACRGWRPVMSLDCQIFYNIQVNLDRATFSGEEEEQAAALKNLGELTALVNWMNSPRIFTGLCDGLYWTVLCIWGWITNNGLS